MSVKQFVDDYVDISSELKIMDGLNVVFKGFLPDFYVQESDLHSRTVKFIDAESNRILVYLQSEK